MKSFTQAVIVIGTTLLAISVAMGFLGGNLEKKISNIAWSDCDGLGRNYVDVQKIEVTGAFSAGSSVTFDIQGNIKKDFTHASTDLKIQYSIIKVFDGNVPENPPKQYVAGPSSLKSTTQLKDEPPAGSYTMTIGLKNEASAKLQCIKVTYKLS